MVKSIEIYCELQTSLAFLSLFDFPFHSAEEDEYTELDLLLMVSTNRTNNICNAPNQKTESIEVK